MTRTTLLPSRACICTNSFAASISSANRGGGDWLAKKDSAENDSAMMGGGAAGGDPSTAALGRPGALGAPGRPVEAAPRRPGKTKAIGRYLRGDRGFDFEASRGPSFAHKTRRRSRFSRCFPWQRLGPSELTAAAGALMGRRGGEGPHALRSGTRPSLATTLRTSKRLIRFSARKGAAVQVGWSPLPTSAHFTKPQKIKILSRGAFTALAASWRC